MKKPKNIHLEEAVIKVLSIKAIECGMVFKTYVEKLLETMAYNISLQKQRKEGGGKK